MRTVTFSHKDVAKLVNDSFVATWVNRNKHFHSCELETEVDIAREKGEAFATRNFGVFFATPEKEVLHYTVGYVAPHWFLPETRLALEVWREGYGEDGRVKPGGAKAVAKLHADHQKEHQEQYQKLGRVRCPADCEDPSRFANNKESLREAIQAMYTVHDRVGKSSSRPLKLDAAMVDYRAGNQWMPITEQ